MHSVLRLVSAAAALTLTASAGTVVLTFGAFQNGEAPLTYWDGGAGSDGTTGGPNYGIYFGSDALSFINESSGGGLNSMEEPSGTDAAMVFLTGTGDVMDVPAGFTTGFSFDYTAPYYTGSVTVWSGLDGGGTELASISLPTTADAGNSGCGGYDYCPYAPVGVTFSGTAQSVIFSGTQNYIIFDDITLGSSTAGGAPEPATLGLFGLGLAGLCVISRKQRKLQ